MNQGNPVPERQFDLFWLNQYQLTLLSAHHHTPLDKPEVTRTIRSIPSKALTVSAALENGATNSMRVLKRMRDEGGTIFCLTPLFLELCQKQDVGIPFESIDETTNPDSIEHKLEELFGQEGNPSQPERR